MSARRLLLLWLVASVLWIGFCLWTEDFSCLVGSGGTWCDQRTGPPLIIPYGYSAIVTTIGVPIVVLLAGIVVFWVLRAVRRRPQ